MSKKLWTIAKGLVAVAILTVLFAALDWRDALQRLSNVSLSWLAVAIALNISAFLLSAWRWQRLAAVLTSPPRYSQAVQFYWIGKFFSTILPSNIGGDVVRAAMARRFGSTTVMLSSIAVERVTGFLVVVTIAVVTLSTMPDLRELIPFGWALPVVLIVSMWIVGSRVVTSDRLKEIVEKAKNGGGLRSKIVSKLQVMISGVMAYRHERGALVFTTLLSVVFYALLFAFQGSLIWAVDGEVTVAALVSAAPVVILVSALPITINGLGVAEAAFVAVYVLVGVDAEAALAAAVLRRLIITASALPGAWFWMTVRTKEADPR
ncbi:MAG: lysylphosphatidylglycerol synthase transmembrane domain-containing protein [Woeseiaceae bacterium]|nr:lysylphosphatidylglycerol synthase transmembrane domain-containing protein [Woeseiaceae bacterium]